LRPLVLDLWVRRARVKAFGNSQILAVSGLWFVKFLLYASSGCFDFCFDVPLPRLPALLVSLVGRALVTAVAGQ
jgi:hypothetical protein